MLGGFLLIAAGLGTGAVVQALGLAWVLGFAAARAWPHPFDRIVIVAAILLMAFSGHNTARLSDARQAPDRTAVEVLLRRLAALPAAKDVELTDVVIGRAVLGDALGLAFPGRDVRSRVDLVDPGEGRQLRVSLYGESRDGWVLETLMRATRVAASRIALVSPDDGDNLPALTPADEPTFAWSVATDDDPGADGFSFLFAGHPANTAGRVVRRLDLSARQLRRTVRDGRVHYAWRPSVRGSHKELLWERGDLTRPGTTLTWTVGARARERLHGFLMPAPRRLSAR